MRIASVLLAVICFGLAAITSHGATPQTVQLCPIASNTFAVPTNATDLLRTVNSANVQSCVPYSAVTADMKLYGGNPHAWQSLSALGIALYQPTSPPVTPPAQPTCPDTFVPVNWNCTSDGKTATCTAPLPQ